MPRSYKSLPRLFVEPALAPAAAIALAPEQANHIHSVLRLGEGADIVLFNGHDGAWRARIVEAGRKTVRVEILDRIAPQTPPSDLWYGFAPLKAGRLDYVVQKATEMGAGTIQPVITEFTQVRRLRPEKLQAYALEAAQQCEVLSLPRIGAEIGLSALLESWRDTHGLRRLIFADEATPSSTPVGALRQLDGLPVGLLVGPEGGFSEDERRLLVAQEFVVPVSLGPRILRADTAAVAALALIQASIGDWR